MVIPLKDEKGIKTYGFPKFLKESYRKPNKT